MFKETLTYLVGCVPAHSLVSNLVEIICSRYHINCEMTFVDGELESLILTDDKIQHRAEICLDNYSVIFFNPYGHGVYVAEDLADLVVYIFYEMVYADKECDAIITKLYHRFN